MRVIVAICLCALATATMAADSNRALKNDRKHQSDWNKFVRDVFALHKQQLKGKQIVKTSRLGGYRDNKNFYREVTYKDKRNGRMLSRIAWERDNPDRIHVIEVFKYDDNGRVIRDYTGAYLPHYREAPIQTLVALHGYKDGLHAFRSFDASGETVYERCTGNYKGKRVEFDFEDYQIEEIRFEKNGVMQTPEYQACFGTIDLDARNYLPVRQASSK